MLRTFRGFNYVFNFYGLQLTPYFFINHFKLFGSNGVRMELETGFSNYGFIRLVKYFFEFFVHQYISAIQIFYINDHGNIIQDRL